LKAACIARELEAPAHHLSGPPKKTQERWSANENSPLNKGDLVTPRYELPEAGKCHEEWRGYESRAFQPTQRQLLVIEAAARAIDGGAFYSVDVRSAVAADLGVTPEQLARNTHGVEGGDFGYDLYFASGALNAIRRHQKAVETARALGLQAGDGIGAIIFNDGKRNTGAVVQSVSADGIELEIRAKRGGKLIAFACRIDALANAIRTAHERGARPDAYEDFKLARLRHGAEPLTRTVAARVAHFGAHELGEAEFLLALAEPESMSQPVFRALHDLAESLDMAVAKGQDCLPDFDATHAEVVRLLQSSPWTLHPDYGCVLAADVEELDRAAETAQVPC
jgi:hypothetical protein